MKRLIPLIILSTIIISILYACNKNEINNSEQQINSISAKLLTDSSFANLTRSFLRQSLIIMVESKNKNVTLDKITEIALSSKSENDYFQKLSSLNLNPKVFDSAITNPFLHLAIFQSTHKEFDLLSSSAKEKAIQKALNTVIKSRKFRNEHPKNIIVNSFKLYAKHLVQIKTNSASNSRNINQVNSNIQFSNNSNTALSFEGGDGTDDGTEYYFDDLGDLYMYGDDPEVLSLNEFPDDGGDLDDIYDTDINPSTDLTWGQVGGCAITALGAWVADNWATLKAAIDILRGSGELTFGLIRQAIELVFPELKAATAIITFLACVLQAAIFG